MAVDPISLALMGSGLATSLFGKKKPATPQTIDTRTPEQQAVSSKLAKILTQGGAAYGGARTATLTSDESYLQDYMRQGLETARPGINRLLSGEFPEEYFNQAIADPTRRQFNERVAPVIRENSELTGNRFADRSAIELGQARGDVESSILAERGKFGLETYRDPLNAAGALSSTLNNAEQLFSVPRTIEQAKLDMEFQEFLRTNPDSGGMIEAMLQFGNQSPLAAFMPNQEQSIGPSLLSAGASLYGSNQITNALNSGPTGYGQSGLSTAQRLAQRNALRR